MNLKRITAFVMVLIMTVTAAFIPSQAVTKAPEANPVETLEENGTPTFTTADFLKIMNIMNTVTGILTGRAFIPVTEIKLTVDETITSYCDYLVENSGLDVVALLRAFKDMNFPLEQITTVAHIDTSALRDKMIERSYELRDEGNQLLAYGLFMLGVYISTIETCDVNAVPTEYENVDEVVLFVKFTDGTSCEMHPSIWINSETGEAYSLNGRGIVNTGFNFNIQKLLVYAPMNCWMRDFGFTMLYDINCYIMPMWNYITRRFKFNYDDRQWQIQIWKGNYLITNGGEVGIYNRSKYAIGTFYNCVNDEERMVMSLKVSHGDEVLVDIEPTLHWWVNGFQMHKRMFLPQSLTLESTISFPNETMRDAFTASVAKEYHHDVTYTVDGLDVSIVW
ncbi:MAG: DUF4474 domain-containing protein [Clostridia bacterium]|nr:DUF4474 domain-containing protein [Clostridia bacterium]